MGKPPDQHGCGEPASWRRMTALPRTPGCLYRGHPPGVGGGKAPLLATFLKIFSKSVLSSSKFKYTREPPSPPSGGNSITPVGFLPRLHPGPTWRGRVRNKLGGPDVLPAGARIPAARPRPRPGSRLRSRTVTAGRSTEQTLKQTASPRHLGCDLQAKAVQTLEGGGPGSQQRRTARACASPRAGALATPRAPSGTGSLEALALTRPLSGPRKWG